jgi:hypothetical protein
VLACATVLAAACLPTGDPPVGRQVIVGRDRVLSAVLPARSPDDGVLRLLISRPNVGVYDSQLYIVSVPDAGGAPRERLLLEHGPGGGCGLQCFQVDSRGRLLLQVADDPSGATQKWILIDPDTGDVLALRDRVDLSPSGQRLASTRYGPPQDIELRESDDRTTALTDVSYGSFVGEDFYYLDLAARLLRVPPGGSPELVREGITSFSALDATQGPPLMMLWTSSDDPLVRGPISLFDPVTLQEQPLGTLADRFISVSPDRRWLLLRGRDDTNYAAFSVLEIATGAEDAFELTGQPGSQPEWRPGTAEIWMGTFANVNVNANGTGTFIKRPGMPALILSATAVQMPEGYSRASYFTRDGRYWFSWEFLGGGEKPGLRVGLADDPNGALFDLTPPETMAYGYRQLVDGRLLIEAFYTVSERSDIYVIDPATGASQRLGEQGRVVEVGDRRVLASLHQIDGYGDLTTIDLDSGRSTLLAAEFAQFAFVERQGADPDLAKPGATVVFQFRARFASPYDGIWVTTLP